MAKRGRRFRFNLRALLAAMTVACVVLGWALADAIRLNRLESDARQVVVRLGGTISESGWSTAKEDRAGWLAELIGLQRGFRTFWFVNLWGTRPTVADLEMLAECGWIRRVDLSNTPIGDAELAVVAQFPRLVELRLANTAVTDRGLQALRRQTRLVVLEAGGTSLTYEGIDALGEAIGNPTLAEPFALSQRPFPGVQIVTLPKFAEAFDESSHTKVNRVHHIYVDGNHYDPACAKHLAHMRSTEDFYGLFHKQRLDTSSFLASLRELQRVTIYGGQLTDADFAAVATLPKLKQLTISGPHHLTGEASRQLEQNHTLRYLELDGSQATLDIMLHVDRFQALKYLSLNCSARSADGQYLRPTDADLERTTVALRRLRLAPALHTVILSGSLFKDEVILALESAQQLRRVIYDKQAISSETIAKLQTRLPDCEIVTEPGVIELELD